MSVFFATGPFARPCISKKYKNRATDVVDQTKPVFVRINDADWASVKILEHSRGKDTKGRPGWNGEVYGLSPASTYQISFHAIEDGSLVHREAISTAAMPLDEQSKDLLSFGLFYTNIEKPNRQCQSLLPPSSLHHPRLPSPRSSPPSPLVRTAFMTLKPASDVSRKTAKPLP